MHRRAISRPLAAAAAAVLITGIGASAPAFAGGPGEDHGQGKSAEAANQHAGERGNSEDAPGAAVAAEAKASSDASVEVEVTTQTGPDHSQGNASTRGSYDEPQPESRADQNDGGANAGTCGTATAGPYCSTRDGSESRNGLGDGKAVGRPAAGTVGKADNKNPPGQLPGPQDHNRGYECDMPGQVPNQGIAEGNPAHTGCVGVVVVTPPKEEHPKPEHPGEEQPKPEQPQVPVTPVTPEAPPVTPVTPEAPPVTPEAPQAPEAPVVLPTEQEVPPARPAPVVQAAPQVAGVSAEVPAAPTSYGTLPATGAEDTTPLVATGLGMTLLGLVLLTRRRLQPQHSAPPRHVRR